MIQPTANGMGMVYRADDGALITVSIFDQVKFRELSDRRGQQIDVMQENTANVSDYLTKLGKLQALIDSGRRTSADQPPVKPRLKVLSDTGTLTYEDIPYLPDPRYPKVDPVSPTGALHPVDNTPAHDPSLAAVMQVLAAMAQQIDALAKKAGV